MTLMPLKLPPGLYMNSTPYGQKGRWADGNRVRWHNDNLEPIGGWQQKQDFAGADLDPLTSTPSTETFRDGMTWLDNSGGRRYIFGSNDGLALLTAAQTVVDVTPVGFTGSVNSPTVNVGYGSWLYGGSTFGTPRPADPNAIGQVYRWNFDTWGEDVIAGAASTQYRDGLYLFDTSLGDLPLVSIAQAPSDINGFVVTDQRIIMTIGSDTENRLVQWCDREDYTSWTPSPTNWAGSYFLQGSGELLSIKKVLNQILIVSDKDAHVARYIGPPYIYGFDRVGDNCGAWNGATVYVTDRFAMWPGRRNFWMYDGTLRPVDCPLQDFLADDVDLTMTTKFFSMGHPSFSEISWYYQSKSGTEVDSYVSYDYEKGTWQKGRLERSCGIDGEGTVTALMVDTDTQNMFDHELDGVTVPDAWVESGPIELSNGDANVAVTAIIPDTNAQGDATYTLKGRQMPTNTDLQVGPYPFGNPGDRIHTRMLAREIRVRIDGSDTARWELGPDTRLDIPTVKTGKR